MAEYTKLPARLLLQVREGERHNLLAEFDILARSSEQDADGKWTHEVATGSVVAGIADGLHTKIQEMLQGEPTKSDLEYLRKLRDWLFEEVPS